jgi:hypothetical protein
MGEEFEGVILTILRESPAKTFAAKSSVRESIQATFIITPNSVT